MIRSTSEYYVRRYSSLESRLDENYYHPLYAEINDLLAGAKFPVKAVGDEKYLARITKGRTPADILYAEVGVPFIGAGNVEFDEIDTTDAPRIDEEFHFKVLEKSRLVRGNVLVTMAGTIGRCASYESDEQCNCNQAVGIITLKANTINPRFLAKCLNSRFGQLQFGKLQKMADQPNIGFDEIKSIRIIIPDDTREQERILTVVKKIEDEAKKSEALVERKLASIDKVILEALGLESDITKPRMDYYASTLDFADRRLDYEYNLPYYRCMDSELKKGKFPLKRLTSPLVAYSDERTNPLERPNELIKYVDIGSIDSRWGIIGKPEEMLGKDAISSRMRSVMHTNQILVSTTRPTRKAVARVTEEFDDEVCSTGFAVMSCSDEIYPEYLLHILRTELLKYNFERYSTGSAYPEINKDKDLPFLEIPVPPKSVQKSIIERIDPIVAEAQQQEKIALRRRTEANEMFENELIRSQ